MEIVILPMAAVIVATAVLILLKEYRTRSTPIEEVREMRERIRKRRIDDLADRAFRDVGWKR